MVSWESHWHKFINITFTGLLLLLCWLLLLRLSLLLWFWLWFFFLFWNLWFCLFFFRLLFDFLFLLMFWFLFINKLSTLTVVMTTRKSPSLTPSLSSSSVLVVAFPLNTIFCDYTSNPFWSLILFLRSKIFYHKQIYSIVKFSIKFNEFSLKCFYC